MKQRNNILFLARWYPNRYDPMPGLFIRRHAEALAMKRNVAVIYPHAVVHKLKNPFEPEITESGKLLEICIYYQTSSKPTAKISNQIAFFKAVCLGYKELKKRQFKTDFVHVHVLTRLAVVAYLLKLTQNLPYGITEHWSRYLALRNEFNGMMRVWLTRFLVKKSSFVTTVTHNLAAAMQEHGLKNPHYSILPNVVDVQLFKQKQKEKSPLFTFIHISCFEDRSKNISGLLRTTARLHQMRQDFKLVMVGEGMDEKAMHDLAHTLNLLPEVVEFTGLLQSEALAGTLAAADALVLFSNYENLPVVIPEAFACGIPVIATRVGGIPEVVDETNGLLVDAGDEEALLQAMNRMMNTLNGFNSNDIRDKVLLNNSKQAVGSFLESLYDAPLLR